MSKPQTIRQFFAQFPDDEACLSHLFNVRFGQGYACPSCQRPSNWYRIKAERAYSCQWCGHHLHPTVGTPFEQTRTPLQLWFYAIYLFTTTRNGVSAKELQRQLGVTYKTAWRMAGLIREHMADVGGDDVLGGEGKIVEVDETMIGGKLPGVGHGNYRQNKTVVLGMVERGGDVITVIVPNVRKESLFRPITANVAEGTSICTDQLNGYRALPSIGRGYSHASVNHNRDEWARGDCHVQTIEGLWAQLKRAINGTHIHVSGKHLLKYAKKAEYRFNRRHDAASMLSQLLSTSQPLKSKHD
jgi:transposase-like protein